MTQEVKLAGLENVCVKSVTFSGGKINTIRACSSSGPIFNRCDYLKSLDDDSNHVLQCSLCT